MGLLCRTANYNQQSVRVYRLLDSTGLSGEEIKNDAHRLGLKLGHPDLLDLPCIPPIPALYPLPQHPIYINIAAVGPPMARVLGQGRLSIDRGGGQMDRDLFGRDFYGLNGRPTPGVRGSTPGRPHSQGNGHTQR